MFETWLSIYCLSNFERLSFLLCEVRILTFTVDSISGVSASQMQPRGSNIY